MIGGRVTVDMVDWLRQRCHGSRLTWPPRAEQLRAEEEAALRRHCVPYERLDLCLRGVGPACGGRAAKAEPAADAGPAAPRGAALIQERLNSATRPTCMSLKVLCRSAASRTTRSYAPTADGRALGRLPLREHARLAALLPGACWHAVGGSQDPYGNHSELHRCSDLLGVWARIWHDQAVCWIGQHARSLPLVELSWQSGRLVNSPPRRAMSAAELCGHRRRQVPVVDFRTYPAKLSAESYARPPAHHSAA